MSKSPPNGQRPLSPHLQIYKPQISTVLSIFHRITGVGLTVGLVLLTVFLLAAASGVECYTAFAECMNSLLGRLLILGFIFAMFYHFCSGLRHLAWDLGWGFDVPTMNRTGWMVVIGAFGGTVCYSLYLLIILASGGSSS